MQTKIMNTADKHTIVQAGLCMYGQMKNTQINNYIYNVYMHTLRTEHQLELSGHGGKTHSGGPREAATQSRRLAAAC